ncbi:MAG TPA: aldo/keto reductase, partial [Terriglobia bacterium]|nr:aldo/keto reductase [Terriglobia bacterium]
MEYRTLQHTDLKVSRVSFGTMTFGSQTDESAARSMVDRCLDAGINFFDTANVYNKGQAEILLGRALAGRREKVILATKVRGKMGNGADESGLSRAAIHKGIDASLQRLNTDHVDVYYLHQPDYGVEIEETLAAMDELVRAGKVRFPAVSNYAAWQVAEIRCLAEKKGCKPPQISQPMYNLLARGIEDEYIPFCERFGIAIVPYNPLAGGLLTGKYGAQRDPKTGGRFDNNKMYQDRYWHEDYFAAVEELSAIAREA